MAEKDPTPTSPIKIDLFSSILGAAKANGWPSVLLVLAIVLFLRFFSWIAPKVEQGIELLTVVLTTLVEDSKEIKADHKEMKADLKIIKRFVRPEKPHDELR